MARRRFRRRDLKRPDEFVSRGRQLIAWAQANGRLLSRVGGAVVAVAVIVAGIWSVRGARSRQANEDLSRALGEFRAGHYAQAATQLADVANRWQSTSPGRVAMLYAANADLMVSNFDSAAALLQDTVDARQWPPYLRQQALVNLAFALEGKGDRQTAAARYAEAVEVGGPYTPLAILGEARSREELGDTESAQKLYERFAREFPQAPENELVSAKIKPPQT